MSDFQAWRSHGNLKKCEKSWQSHGKMKIYHKNDILGQTQNVTFQVIFLNAHATYPFCAQGCVLKGHGISLFYHGKVLEKSWNFKAQKEYEPC